ncbi:hypothetical protein BN903_95 [Halorubrum sp. AJ67]|nr:hypothetical protein BN903_95 [Halorubrum sp. AJ67]
MNEGLYTGAADAYSTGRRRATQPVVSRSREAVAFQRPRRSGGRSTLASRWLAGERPG